MPRYTYGFKVAPILQYINVRERKCKVTFSIISDHRRLPLIFSFLSTKGIRWLLTTRRWSSENIHLLSFTLNCCSKRTNVIMVIEYIGHIGDVLPLRFNFVIYLILCILWKHFSIEKLFCFYMICKLSSIYLLLKLFD